eukprot:g15318.t1
MVFRLHPFGSIHIGATRRQDTSVSAEPCHARQAAQEAFEAQVPEEVPALWPLWPRSSERWCFLARRLRSGLRGRPDGVATLSFAAKREEIFRAWQDHFRGLPNIFGGFCVNSWGHALCGLENVEAYAVGMRSIDERAAKMCFPLDAAYMQVLPQKNGLQRILLTMPVTEIEAFLKEGEWVPHISEMRTHSFRVPLPPSVMERLNPAVQTHHIVARVACVGDSLTACGYPKYLQALFDRANMNVQVRGFGVCGATAQKFSDQPYWEDRKLEEARWFPPMGDRETPQRRPGHATPRGGAPRASAAPAAAPEKKDKDEAEELRLKLQEARQNLKLTSAPITTVTLFAISATEYLIFIFLTVVRSIYTWLVALPLVLGYFYLKLVYAPSLFEAPVCGVSPAAPLWHFELALKEAAWWIILGVLSSVGFGTGLHSGMMFLFPHVLQVVTAAESCRSTVGLIVWYQHPCKLDCSTVSGPFDDSTVTFLNLWSKVAIPCMLWGFGTAIGELPPYLVSKAARMSGSTDEDFAKEMEEAKSKTDVFNRMKLWTVNFTEKHGFLGIFLLASWPNAAFDMCGMCCGYLLMPFWTFFIATSLGKGVVKSSGQAVLFVNLFGSRAFEVMLTGIDVINSFIEAVVGRNLELRPLASNLRSKLLAKFQQQNRASAHFLRAGWGLLVASGGRLVLASCVPCGGFPPEHLFHNDDDKRLEFDEICKLYDNEEEDKMKEIAHRVLKEWDKDGDKDRGSKGGDAGRDLTRGVDGAISVSEAQCAASVTDGKISLSSLDPGAPTSFLKVCWELFIAGLVLYFVVSIMNQMAQSKQAEYDEAKVEELKKKSKKKCSHVQNESDYRDLCVHFLERQEPRPELLLATPPPAYSDDLVDTEVVNSKLPSLVPVIAEKARGVINAPLEEQAKRSRSSVPAEFLAKASVVDTFSALGGASLQRRGYFSDDGIHPNERGTRLLALVVFADLRAKVSKYLRKRADEAAREVPDNPLGLCFSSQLIPLKCSQEAFRDTQRRQAAEVRLLEEELRRAREAHGWAEPLPPEPAWPPTVLTPTVGPVGEAGLRKEVPGFKARSPASSTRPCGASMQRSRLMLLLLAGHASFAELLGPNCDVLKGECNPWKVERRCTDCLWHIPFGITIAMCFLISYHSGQVGEIQALFRLPDFMGYTCGGPFRPATGM